MSSYKSFAIVGTGVVGSALLNAFVNSKKYNVPGGYSVRVLTRSKDKLELAALSAKGVDVIPVDYSSELSIASALAGADVVLSALRDGGLDIQSAVVRAAKVANVKLFVPSEYGRDTFGETSEYLKIKAATHEVLKELTLPYTLFFVGTWPELLFGDSLGPYLGIDLNLGKFNLFGDGNTPVGWTSPRSFAPFVHYVLTTLPASKLDNRAFRIEGDKKTFREIIAIWEKKHGRLAEVKLQSPEEVQKFKDETPLPVVRFLVDAWSDESLMRGDDNGVWPEWNPLKWEDLMP